MTHLNDPTGSNLVFAELHEDSRAVALTTRRQIQRPAEYGSRSTNRRASFPAVPWFVSTLLLFLTATGCEKKPQAAPPPPPVVQVITVSPRDIPIYSEWIGTLDGYVNAQIHAQVTGYLLTQNYLEGNPVKKGDLLFQIDPAPFQAALDKAEADLAQANAQLERTEQYVKRYTPLAKSNAVSQQDLDDAIQSNLMVQATVKADRAAVETAKLNLGFTHITAPIDGLAGIALAQIGDLVGPGTPALTTVSTIDPIKVYFPVSEQAYLSNRRQYTNAAELATHEQEMELQLILTDGSIYPEKGKFYFTDRQVNVGTGTLQLAGLFPNPNLILRPGQYARVRARTQIRKGAFLVPQRSVAELQGSYQVAIVDSGDKAHLRTVTVGEEVGQDWVIEKGLQDGDRVVVEGLQKIKEGAPVQPQAFSAAKQTNEPAADPPRAR